MTKKRFRIWVKRKIRNGRVKIYGQWYEAYDYHREYKGELDGLIGLFGRYEYNDSHVNLWGFEEFDWENQPHHIDKYIYWIFWRKVDA
jgi:hypothetical protein